MLKGARWRGAAVTQARGVHAVRLCRRETGVGSVAGSGEGLNDGKRKKQVSRDTKPRENLQ